MDKIELELVTIAEGVSYTNSYSLLLKEKGGNRRIVIVIGFPEAQAIAIALDESIRRTRPYTHDLFYQVCNVYNIDLEEVIITDVQEGIFYATLVCKKDELIAEVDSRSSDAIALAIRFNAPIFINRSIFDELSTAPNNTDTSSQSFEEFESEIEKDKPTSLKTKSIAELKELIKEALQNEDYEYAAKLRDEIAKRNQ